MSERLHNILDGRLPTHSREQLFSDAEEEQEFLELKALEEELRRNADHDGLTSAEKTEIGAGLAAALGFAPSETPAQTAVAGGERGAAGTSSGWVLKSIAALVLGTLLGVGGFALIDGGDGPDNPVQTVGVPVHSSTPAFFPFALPEPSPGAACDSLVVQLQDSIRALQQENQGQAKPRKSVKKKRVYGRDAVPGERPK